MMFLSSCLITNGFQTLGNCNKHAKWMSIKATMTWIQNTDTKTRCSLQQQATDQVVQSSVCVCARACGEAESRSKSQADFAKAWAAALFLPHKQRCGFHSSGPWWRPAQFQTRVSCSSLPVWASNNATASLCPLCCFSSEALLPFGHFFFVSSPRAGNECGKSEVWDRKPAEFR